MDIANQERTRFRYHQSVYEAEFSRNLHFGNGRQMDQVFHCLIDRIRAPLDLRTVTTLLGRRKPTTQTEGAATGTRRGGRTRDAYV